jgi:hypothetical protein
MLGIMVGALSCNHISAPDVSNVKVELTCYDFYKDFYAIDTNNVSSDLQNLNTKYSTYLPFYLDTLAIGTISHNDSSWNLENVKYFLTHTDYRSLMDTVSKAFSSTDEITEKIVQTFKYIKYYDLDIALPEKIYYAVSGLNNMLALSANNTLTLCLDYFLGRDYLPYTQIQTPDYLLDRLEKSYIPIAVAQGLYLDKYPADYIEKSLLNLMIDQGKLQYYLSLVVPDAPAYKRFGFTPNAYNWCENNEAMIYQFFASQEMLYSKDLHKVLRYVQDGPFSSGMPQESPGNTGSYIGYKIVKQYMENTKVTLKELLQEQDYKKILTFAKYKP